jgi:hypothetical protein
MNYRQPSLQEVIANIPEPPPPSQDDPVVIEKPNQETKDLLEGLYVLSNTINGRSE